MRIDIPDHSATDIGIMLASMGYYMISDAGKVPSQVFLLAEMFNQMMEDTEGKGDFFETIAQKFESVADIIRNDSRVKASSSFKDWN